MFRLMNHRFIESFGCVRYDVRSVPEYTVEAALVLVALLFHAPTSGRMLGARPISDRDARPT
jgi:hypothetical protein